MYIALTAYTTKRLYLNSIPIPIKYKQFNVKIITSTMTQTNQIGHFIPVQKQQYICANFKKYVSSKWYKCLHLY